MKFGKVDVADRQDESLHTEFQRTPGEQLELPAALRTAEVPGRDHRDEEGHRGQSGVDRPAPLRTPGDVPLVEENGQRFSGHQLVLIGHIGGDPGDPSLLGRVVGVRVGEESRDLRLGRHLRPPLRTRETAVSGDGNIAPSDATRKRNALSDDHGERIATSRPHASGKSDLWPRSSWVLKVPKPRTCTRIIRRNRDPIPRASSAICGRTDGGTHRPTPSSTSTTRQWFGRYRRNEPTSPRRVTGVVDEAEIDDALRCFVRPDCYPAAGPN